MQPERCIAGILPGRPEPSDWSSFVTWAAGEGWRVPTRELALYRLELAESAFVLRGGEGQPLGFVTVCRHQRSAWIGNLIVDPAQRGAGYGRRLFKHAVSTMSGIGVANLWLTASADGRPIYESYGFRETERVERWVWRCSGVVHEKIDHHDRNDLYQLARADAAAWGDCRVGMLTLLARGGRIVSSGSTVALLQPGTDVHILGPWLSADLCPRANRQILAGAMEGFAGLGEMVVDVIGSSPVRKLLSAAGFQQMGETVLMTRGEGGKVRFGEIVALASLGSMG